MTCPSKVKKKMQSDTLKYDEIQLVSNLCFIPGFYLSKKAKQNLCSVRYARTLY